jgi:hypothetical protein
MPKSMKKNNQNTIYDLVIELSSLKPDTKLLKSLCDQAGLVYESDLVLLMSKVLVIASSTSKARSYLAQEV